jgi:hypothetical protein
VFLVQAADGHFFVETCRVTESRLRMGILRKEAFVILQGDTLGMPSSVTRALSLAERLSVPLNPLMQVLVSIARRLATLRLPRRSRSARGFLGHAAVALTLIFQAGSAFAWGPDGHRTVAVIAGKLLTGKNAEKEALAVLGSITLEQAAVWADCAKGVDPVDFKYKGAGKFPECAPFENPAGEAAMIDFVKRNATNCHPKPGEETCHKQYHYADIAIQHDDYKPTFVGARPDDIVGAITAALAVLQDKPPPAPFSIKDKREALLLLVHYVGDIHQPLHVGAVYLDESGKLVNPDIGQFDLATETKGGNLITASQSGSGKSENLHATWDTVPDELTPAHVNAAWINKAEAVTRTQGSIAGWPSAWASDTQKQADKALKTLKFGAKSGTMWSTKLSNAYFESMHATQKTQLTKAGARLAQLLEALWP